MPRGLGRLRFRPEKPSKPLNVPRVTGTANPRLVVKHVQELSKPAASLAIRTVINPKWKQLPGKRSKHLIQKPYSLRAIVDPEGTAKHGEIIYVFRNIKTNQVIYSLSEMMDQYHLEQIPFIGKHSKPPELRPDEWKPYFVATFPSPEQGHQAFRKLREFRKLHEVAWHRTHPQWLKLPREQRIQKIMDQAANTVADIAAVMNHQQKQAGLMKRTSEQHERKVTEYMDTRWRGIHELAALSTRKDKRDGDNPKWLTTQISNLEWQLNLKHNQDEGNQRRLNTAKRSHEIRLRKIELAQRKAEQYAEWENNVSKKAALANTAGAEQRLEELIEQRDQLKEDLANPDPEATPEEIEHDRQTLSSHHSEINRLQLSFAAKEELETRNHYIPRSILPLKLQKQPPTPFTMDGMTIRWVDLRDLEYARSWPPAVVMDILPVNAAKQEVAFLNQADYHAAVQDEVASILGETRASSSSSPAFGSGLPSTIDGATVEPAEKKTGVLGMVSRLNPFGKRAEA